MSMATERPPRPEPLQVIFDQIPGETRYLNNWVLWRYEWVEGKDGKPGKWDKPPYQPNGRHAKSTAKHTWIPFNTAKEAYERGLNLPADDPLHFDGVGFVPAMVPQAENNLQFGDLDKCRLAGQLSPQAKEDLDLINSYAEISPSGTGIRFIAKGCPPYPQGQDGSKKGPFELYQGRHYLTITGHRLTEYPATIEKRPEELNIFYDLHFSDTGQHAPESAPGAETGNKLTDDDIICLASEAGNAKKFMALMGGDINGYPSHSEADQAFCNLVVFYTTDDAQIDRIFRRSGLYREKWERAGYREATIRKAISGSKEHYKGNGPKDIEPETVISEDERPKIERTADNIMKRGKPLKFLVQQAQRNHVGDKDIMKHMFASVACTNSETSAGIQPELNGPKGHGKTDAVKATFHCIPEKWKLSASISAKALYYYKDLLTGTIIFSDDVQWSEDLEATVKRSMGSFQEPQTHFTLDAHRNPLPQVMPARLVWWLSSVETVSNDQLKDRQYSLDIDGTPDHSEKVSNYLRQSRAKKIIRFSVDWRIEVARVIVGRIKEHEPFKVVIDCAEFADWKVKEDHRTQNKFWDLVEAFAILRYEQRRIDDDGWLHASVDDFNEAKTIFMKRKANHRTKLSDAQTRLVKSVIKLGMKATRSNIAKDVGISYNAVKKGLEAIEANTPYIVHAPGINGELFYECSVGALEVAFAEGDIVTLPQDYKDLEPH